jgi:hypothetical protein
MLKNKVKKLEFIVVLSQLTNFTTSELLEVKKRATFLLGVAAPTTKGDHPEQDWLLEGFTNELRRRGLWARSTFPSKLLPEGYAEKSAVVRAHLLKGLAKPNPRSVERMALGGLAAAALADYLTKVQVPLGPKTLLNNIEKVPLALEESFPGYWAQKLLGFCVKLK